MQGDFFQVLRRVQKEERNKSSLARVDNDFYKQLRDYIKDLERSVASDPFGNEQLLLNNAQRIATEICELRESKITKAANNNIYRSFLLFKKDNPQFDLLDTTPLNLTDEEETLYFSLMDALKNHRYRISLDEYTEEDTIEDEYEDEYDEDVVVDEDDEDDFVEESYESAGSIEDESAISEDLEDEISNALGESDEILDRLGQIKDAKVVTDERYEPIDKQVANQMYPGQGTAEKHENEIVEEVDDEKEAPILSEESDVEVQSNIEESDEEFQFNAEEPNVELQSNAEESDVEVQSSAEESLKRGSFVSSSLDDIFKEDPDSQFVDLDKIEPNYDDDYYNSIAAGSNYAPPSEDDFNMIFAKPKKPKSSQVDSKSSDIKGDISSSSSQVDSKNSDIKGKISSSSGQTELGFSSGLDVKEAKSSTADGLNKAIQKSEKEDVPKVVDKTKGGLFSREEIENTTVVINEDIDEMVGIDGKVYGPFLANDVVVLPKITAQILIDNNKASLVKL